MSINTNRSAMTAFPGHSFLGGRYNAHSLKKRLSQKKNAILIAHTI